MRAGRVGVLVLGIAVLLMGVEAGKRLANVAPVRETGAAAVKEPTKPPLFSAAQFTALPLSFERNQGQTSSSVQYLARGKGYTLLLAPTEARILSTARVSDPASVQMRLIDANPNPQMTAENPLPGKVHYFVGSDPQKWRRNIPTSAHVRSRAVYPGIDLVYYGSGGQVEYDFIVAPGANPNRICLEFEGAKTITTDKQGNLHLQLPDGQSLLQRKPVVYQDTASGRREIAGGYRFEGKNRIRFTLGEYDRSKPLVIDPIIQYSTFWGGDPVNFSGQGGEDRDESGQVAVDTNGEIYLTGVTVTGIAKQTNPVPVTSRFRVAAPGSPDDREIFITRFKEGGRQVDYSVIIGSDTDDFPLDIAVRGQEATILMATNSSSLPIVNPLRGRSNNTTLYYVFQLNANGNGVKYGSFVTGRSGNAFEAKGGVAVNSVGQIVIVGGTDELEFPVTRSGVQNKKKKGRDIFVMYLSPNQGGLNQLLYSTYLGGDGDEEATDIFLKGNIAHITGSTSSRDINARSGTFGFGAQSFQIFQEKNGGGTDAFVLCMNLAEKNRDSLAYFTYLGGSGTDIGNAITVNADGEAFVTGLTGSANFPIRAAVDRVNQVNEAFVIQLNLTGSFPIFSTFLGGNDREQGEGIALDRAGNIWVVGTTTSTRPGSLTGRDSPVSTPQGGKDGFIVQLSLAGERILFSTLLGGASDDERLRIVDNVKVMHITGQTRSPNFPVTADAIRKTNPGRDAFLTTIAGIDGCATQFPVVRITRSGVSRNLQTGEDHITLTLKTPANTPGLPKPLRVVIPKLPPTVTLINKTGTTVCLPPENSAFIDVPVGGDNRLTPNEEVKVLLRFKNPDKVAIPIAPFVAAGPGQM